MYDIEEYVAEAGSSPFAEWLNGLKDNRARMRLLTRLDRAALGNLGDWRNLTDARGIAELRDGYGPGYRVYFSFVGQNTILLRLDPRSGIREKRSRKPKSTWRITNGGPSHESEPAIS